MSDNILTLLAEPAFIPHTKKLPLFLAAVQDALLFHKKNCAFYAAFLDANGFGGQVPALAAVPPLPIGIFKERKLVSVLERDIIKITHSSATTGGTPSTIVIDRTTRDRQRTALSKIMAALVGEERRPFVIFDSRAVLGSTTGELSSRATTIRGLLAFSSGFVSVLDEELRVREDLLEEALEKTAGRPAVFFGATTVLYDVYEKYKNNATVRAQLRRFVNPTVLYSGGWKKLAYRNVDPASFKTDLAEFFSVRPERLVDFYGMIEQPGVIYPECGYGSKHVPTYAEVIIRDMRTMQPVADDCEGMIEVISPLAQSYPGVALLTDDVGKRGGDDGCRCGRPGQFFYFVRRAPQAEAKGCADTFDIPV